MRIHCIRHETFEDLAYIEKWIHEKKFQLSFTCTFLDEEFPAIDNFDALIIMGGSASVYEEDKFPWLIPEKRFIEKTIEAGKYVMGVCLGSQLIADLLGAKIYAGDQKEIGWFPLKFSNEARKTLSFLPEEEMVFHWHGDTYDIPTGAINIGSSDTTANQGFIFQNNIIALQFHFEMTPQSLINIIKGAATDLKPRSTTVQSEMEIMSGVKYCVANNNLMAEMLEFLIK